MRASWRAALMAKTTPFMRLAVVLVCSLSGCFSPDLSQVTLTCTDTIPGRCPPGWMCIEGVCRSPGYAPDAAASDLRMSSPADLAIPSGCASGRGTPLGSGYACPGSFNPGQVAAQCAPRYAPCTSAV